MVFVGVCVFVFSRDGAVGVCGLVADGFLRGAQSVEGVAGKPLKAGSTAVQGQHSSILRQQ